MRLFFLFVAQILFAASILAAPNAEIRVRDTSYYVGTPFNFYVHVTDLTSAPEPDLYTTEDLQIRYVGAAPASRSAEEAFTFTYEAVPLLPGKLEIPGGTISLTNEDLEIPSKTITVETPDSTDEMEVRLILSQDEAYVGEPVLMTFEWITNLSLNGVKAVNLSVPPLYHRRLKARPTADPVDPNAKNAIGLPVSQERIICGYHESERNGKPALILRFQKLLVPNEAGSISLPPITLLCSFTDPREENFTGARYPSYFDNEFFDQDVTGEYQRLMVQSEPFNLLVKPLPQTGKPANFSGIVGELDLTTSVSPAIAEVSQPMTLTLQVAGHAHPHLLSLPALEESPAMKNSFQIPAEAPRSSASDGVATFLQTIRPLRETVSAVPAVEISYFNPRTEAYELAASAPIPVTVSRASSVNVFDASFSDGTQLKNEIEAQEGGIFHNISTERLLQSQSPNRFGFGPISVALLLLAPIAYGLVWWLTRASRLAQLDPDAARRKLAFRQFQNELHALPADPTPQQLSETVRTYLRERFDLPAHVTSSREIEELAGEWNLSTDESTALARLIDVSDADTFSKHDVPEPGVNAGKLLGMVSQIEKQAVVLVAALLTGLTFVPDSEANESQAERLEAAARWFQEANEAALVEPSRASDLYRAAAEQIEEVIDAGELRNADLYYNAANTWFLAGDTGRAILNYRRAEAYQPTDGLTQKALRHARTQRVDIFPEKGLPAVVKDLLFWHSHLDQKARMIIAVAAWAGIWAVLGIALFRPVAWKWNALITCGMVLLLVGVSMIVYASRDLSREAVVLEEEVTARKGDGFIYDPAFSNPLHAGAEVRILEEREQWVRVEVENGNRGWIPNDSAEVVQDW